MNIAVRFGCLVAVAVIAGAIGLPEKELVIVDQTAEFDEDHLVRKGIDHVTRRECKIAGGECQALTQDCDGELRESRFYCKNSKKSGCCIPPGCVFGSKAYPNGSIIGKGCIKLLCNKGELIPNFDDCDDFDFMACPTSGCSSSVPCDCKINAGIGCTLGAPTIPGHACRCTLTGPLTSANTTCTGVVVSCNNQALPSCSEPGTDYDHCMQGTFGSIGNCCGYPAAKCATKK